MLLVVAAALCPEEGSAQRGRGAAPDPVEDAVALRPDLYYIPGAGANSVVRVTGEGLILVDTKNPDPAIAGALMEKIRSISPLPVRYVLNTHHHPDHVGNNQAFVDAGATVVGLENLRLLMTTDARTRDIPGPPTTTFERDYALDFGGARVEAHFYGASHTGSDTIVHFPDQRFVMISDTINGTGPTPRIVFANGGSAVQVPGLLDRILALDWDVALAGRGEPLTRADVEAFRDDWNTLMARVRAAVAGGATRETLADAMAADPESEDDLDFAFDAAFFSDLFDELQVNPTGEPRLSN
jgi:glyoxylase-like metal-dependent hydrolase (beta-lactamase superfamily II)